MKRMIIKTNIELFPCPFCGGEPEVVTFHNVLSDEDLTYIRCQQCEAQTKELNASIRFVGTIQIDAMPIIDPIEYLAMRWNARKN